MMQVSFSNAAQLYQQNQNLGRANPGKTSSSDSSLSPKQSENFSDQVSLPSRNQVTQNNAADQNEYGRQSAPTETASESTPTGQQFSTEERAELQKLKARDTEVRAHEQAHLASAGQHAAGGPTFVYQTGPDGKRYAVGGEVPIDISKEPTPEATITKMRAVRRAALAPASPSPADRQIASQAASLEAQAITEKQLNESDQHSAIDTSSPISDYPSSESTTRPQGTIGTNRRAMMIAAYKANAELA
jgi:hypothetical protein